MVDAADLKRRRGGHRATATKRLREVDDALAVLPMPDLIRLEQLKLGLLSTLDSLKGINNDLLAHVDPAYVVTEIEQSEKVRDEIFLAIAKIDGALKRGTRPRSSTPTGSLGTPPVTAKLPKLTLKSFSGSLMGWSAFWDAYKTAIHDNHGLNNVDKFNYLTLLLEGTAKEAVEGLALTDANYTEAIAILERRFGDKE